MFSRSATAPLRALSFARRSVTKFAKSHEYVRVEGTIGTVGITDFAQAALGDVVFVGLPEVGAVFKKGCVAAAIFGPPHPPTPPYHTPMPPKPLPHPHPFSTHGSAHPLPPLSP